MRVMAPLIRDAMAGQFAQMGIEVSDMDTFTRIITEEMTVKFTQAIRQPTADAYLAQFDEAQLADIAAFIATPSGQAWMTAQADLMAAGQAAGEAAGASVMREIGPAVADRLEAENISITSNLTLMEQVLRQLRQ